jgi:hypothetical protein
MNHKHKEVIAAARKTKEEEANLAKAKKSQAQPVSRNRKLIELTGALLFTAVGMTTSLPISIALPIWIISFIVFIYVALDTIPYADKLSKSRKGFICTLITLLSADLSAPFIRHKYMEERSAVLDGYIRARNPWKYAQPVIEFGDSGIKYFWRPTDEPLRFLKDTKLSLRTGENGIEISTTILDHAGNRIVWIENNHWHVAAPPISGDKNFTDDTLEVLDSGGRVILQAHLLPDRVQMRGEWHDKFNKGVEISDCYRNGGTHGCLQVFGENWSEEKQEATIHPIFKYPSSAFLGELIKK